MTDHLQLLSALKVKKIYWIDDDNASTDDLNLSKLVSVLAEKIYINSSNNHLKNCLKVLKASKETNWRNIANKIEDVCGKDLDNKQDQILEILNEFFSNFPLDSDPKKVAQDMLLKLPQPFSKPEKEILKSTFSNNNNEWEWHPISFTQWANTHSEILNHHNANNNAALLIVDLQNNSESNTTCGIDVLEHWSKWVRDKGSMRNVFAIAFTSLYQPNDEIKEGRRFTKNLFQSPLDNQLPVLVLSKMRLSPTDDAKDAVSAAARDAFKRALGRLRACLLHWDLFNNIQKTFTDSVQVAFTTLQELSIEELLMAISGTHTRNEGVSDVDTLVRMVAIAQRAALLTQIGENEKVLEVLIELRKLSEVVEEYNKKMLYDTTGIENLRASEVYDPGRVINGLFSPLATGDIFEISRNGQIEYHMLVSNICDLTLRGNKGKRKLVNGMLLKLSEKTNDNKETSKPLPAFPNDSPLKSKNWCVEYNLISVAPLAVLDLCWTNKDGHCAWQSSLGEPPQLAHSQQLRFKAILQEHKEQRPLIEQFFPEVQKEYEEGGENIVNISYSISRVGRISPQFAHAICEGFARNIARPSLAHDMTGGSI